ncbi:MAG: hypothetical protein ABH843_02855 [Candidatus Omnitrophota bacterium]
MKEALIINIEEESPRYIVKNIVLLDKKLLNVNHIVNNSNVGIKQLRSLSILIPSNPILRNASIRI